MVGCLSVRIEIVDSKCINHAASVCQHILLLTKHIQTHTFTHSPVQFCIFSSRKNPFTQEHTSSEVINSRAHNCSQVLSIGHIRLGSTGNNMTRHLYM